MAEIQGLVVSHFPSHRLKPELGTAVLKGNIARAWADKPHLNNPANWPEAMKRDWRDDEGATASRASQEHMVQQFRKLRQAIDDFKPDLMVMLYRDFRETWGNYATPRYWIHGHESVDMKLFPPNNIFDEDTERVDTIKGHPEAALYLARELQKQGFNPLFAPEPLAVGIAGGAKMATGHNSQAGLVHLNWDRREFKEPVVAFAVDPYSYKVRGPQGMSAWNPKGMQPLTPGEAFDLGGAVARILHASPWRVTLVAATAWSNLAMSSVNLEKLHQDIEADKKRYEQWVNGEYTKWGDDFTSEQLEQHSQWDMLVSIILAGAMTELGSKLIYSDFYGSPVLVTDWVTSIFEPS